MDTNNDGRISVTELMKAQQALGCNPTLEETREMIKEVDSDNSGFIELDEFITLMSERYGALEYQNYIVTEAFQYFDRDKKGYLNKDQLYSYLTKCGEVLTEREFNDVIKDIDTDGDGRIDIQEFAALLTKKNPL
ncbi:calmodulin [Plakobranchus ocellatus]|uniref:Calmodulin n=1 Tax=Plakobranchus ocellatus TaxID=259542 RepID=A0AAV4BZL6_9GAST|nr:calmodulin [Plakobranchus ocellatus]